MADVKVAVIGAGSYVFGPTVLSGALCEHQLDGIELALMDVDADAVHAMAGVGKRVAKEKDVDARISATTDRSVALDGADFVLCAAAPGMRSRFEVDASVVQLHMPDHVITEFGGIIGISYSLRQIAFIEGLVADMKERCASAPLYTVSNPLPRVCQAAHMLGVKTVGLCNASLDGYGMLWRLFHGEQIGYPFAVARRNWNVKMAGLNHFSWVLHLHDRVGKSLVFEVRKRLKEGGTSGQPNADRLATETGFLVGLPDGHTQDFLPPAPEAVARTGTWHGSDEQRRERVAKLKAMAEGAEPCDDLLRHIAWEKPMDLVAAMAFDVPAEFHALNMVNTGQLPDLPEGIFVETPVRIGSQGVSVEQHRLPTAVLAYCQKAAEETDTIVRAALERKRSLVRQAVEMDPTITDKAAGVAAMEQLLEAHADVLPRYE